MKHLWILILLFHGVSGIEELSMYVMEGASVTLFTGVEINQQEETRWYFNDTHIAEITGDQSKICTDDQCDERFRDRLKLDHQTGSLTIMNIRTSDEGEYKLQINSSSRFRERMFVIIVHDLSGADRLSVPVMEEESITLNTGVITYPKDLIIWYFKYSRFAEINGKQRMICRGDQCHESFIDRLKLDHETGSLTIMNITDTDFGEYLLTIVRNNNESEMIFNVHGVSAAEREEMKRKSVKEGESVTLNPAVTRNPSDVMKWYFNDILITEITGDQSKICTDDQCDERFRDRLKLDHQTGSLTIMNTRNTDEGEYKLQINSIRFNIMRSFSVNVTGFALSSSAVPRLIAVVLAAVSTFALNVVAVIYLYKNLASCIRNQQKNHNEINGVQYSPANGIRLRQAKAIPIQQKNSKTQTQQEN